MELTSNDLFYSRLPVNEISLSDLLTEDHLFFKVPSNWYVVVTDIKDSTAALNRGLHETVNLVATGCIVAVLNIAYKAGLSIPFFFGGDGASFILPPSIVDMVMKSLLVHRQNTQQNFDLELRVGKVAVAFVYESGQQLNISKFKTSQVFSIPVLLGDGLSFAEKVIKANEDILSMSVLNETLDLSGMQCRWDKVLPPLNGHEVVSLLVVSRSLNGQSAAFRKVIKSLDEIYGNPQMRRPISVARLKMKTSLAKISLEMRARWGGFRPFYFMKGWISMVLGYYYFRTRKGKYYLTSLVDMSDTLVIDGRINTVISGTPEQRALLQAALDTIEASGEILYGLHVSRESVISCYVRNLNDRHVHFVDGAEGGYTMAAAMLKRKIISN
jgi:hypothetical protein